MNFQKCELFSCSPGMLMNSKDKCCSNRIFGLFTFCTTAYQRASFFDHEISNSAVESRRCGKNHRKNTLSTFGCRKNMLLESLQKLKSVLSDNFPNQGSLLTCLLPLALATNFLKLQHSMDVSRPLRERRLIARKFIFAFGKDVMALLTAKISSRLEIKVLIHLILTC